MRIVLIVVLGLIGCVAFGQSNHVSKKQILGFWMPDGEVEGVHFSKDSIYYASYFKSFKYTLTKDDTLIIYFDNGYTPKSKVFLRKDTLRTEGELSGYFVRVK